MKNFTIILILLSITMLSDKTCCGQNAIIKAGIARVDITPAESLYMGGYDESCRFGPSQGNHGNIYVRSLALDDNAARIVFIEIDVVSLQRSLYDSIRNLVSVKTGIPFDHIFLGCTHDHAAPYPGESNSKTDWYKNFPNNIIKSVQAAIADLEPVKMGGGIGSSRIAMNRRKSMTDTVSFLTFDENNSSQSYGKYKTDLPVLIREMEGVYRLGSNPDGPIDSEVGIIRIDKLSGQPKAVFVNYACHGTSMGGRNNIVCPEWNGHMLEYVEKQFPGVMGIFAQGAAGDINPRFVGGLDGYKDNPENTAELGYEIGREVARVFKDIQTESPANPAIRVVHDNIICPKKYGEVVRDFRSTTVAVTTTAIRAGDFVWVTFPGELFHEIGQTIKSTTHARFPFFVGYCNGSVGYLPTRAAYSEGGYEPWTTQFDPATEKIYVAGVEKLLLRLY